MVSNIDAALSLMQSQYQNGLALGVCIGILVVLFFLVGILYIKSDNQQLRKTLCKDCARKHKIHNGGL